MTQRFTGKAIPRGISLPDDLWSYLELRAEQEDRSVSKIVRRALEKDIFDRAQTHADQWPAYVLEGDDA